MKKIYKNLLFASLLIIVASCAAGGNNTQQGQAPEYDNAYNIYDTITLDNTTYDLYLQNEYSAEYYYSVLDVSISLESWTFQYECHPVVLLSNEDDLSLATSFLTYLNDNFEAIKTLINQENLTVFDFNQTYYLEQEIQNDKTSDFDIVLIEEYYSFLLLGGGSHHYIYLPLNVNFLKLYDNEIQNWEKEEYVVFDSFLTENKITKK